MADHNHNHDQPRDREVIVTDTGRRGPNIGGIIAAIVGAIVVLLLAWMLFFQGGGDAGDVEVPVPDDVTVETTGGGGDAG